MIAARADIREAVKKYEHWKDKNFERYEALVTRDVIKIKEKYFGKYSDDKNEVENSGLFGDIGNTFFGWENTAKIEDMQKDTMNCRHMTPVCSVLLHEVGINNHTVVSAAPFFLFFRYL